MRPDTQAMTNKRQNLKDRARARPSGLVTALDVGSSKIACMIARPDETLGLRVIGYSHQKSAGVHNGMIVDMQAASEEIGRAVQNAEKIARETIDGVIVNIAGRHLASYGMTATVPLSRGVASQDDVLTAVSKCFVVEKEQDCEMIQAVPTGFVVDNTADVSNPTGLCGREMKVDVNAITGCPGALRNLRLSVEGNFLKVENRCASAFASGLACLVEDELSMGCALVDIGAATTDLAVFLNGKPIYVTSIPVGGAHVTSDLAHGLSTPLAQADNIKTKYGSAYAPGNLDTRLVEVPVLGEEDSHAVNQVERATINRFIQPRMEEIFEMVRAALVDTNLFTIAGRNVVITGGTSQMPGVLELAQIILNKRGRTARPHRLFGVPENFVTSDFSTVIGLLAYSLREEADLLSQPAAAVPQTAGFFARVGSWLKENL